jgi:hypothetical protein
MNFVLQEILSLDLTNGNCHINSQLCFKGFKGIFVIQ